MLDLKLNVYTLLQQSVTFEFQHLYIIRGNEHGVIDLFPKLLAH